MAKIARVPITNVFMDGDYTGRILVGPKQQPLNVILDTGSSALALDRRKYAPDLSHGDKSTDLAQTDSYADGSRWTGAVIKTAVTIGGGPSSVTLNDANVALTYSQSANIFGSADGILGLAYAPLDDAFAMPQDSWKTKYDAVQVRAGKRTDLVPYLTQLDKEGVTFDKIAFYTPRSLVHEGGGGEADPLNRGWMIVGGGEESKDLYTGGFQTVKVMSDAWYCTNLKAIIVGDASPIDARLQGPKGMPSNSIIDSGTNSLSIGPQMLKALLSKFNAPQQEMLANGIEGKLISVTDLNLPSWPAIRFVLQGDAGDVSLQVPAANYWQVNAGKTGMSMAAFTSGEAGLSILGLPIMNGYFTIFDGEADGGKGAVKFAKART